MFTLRPPLPALLLLLFLLPRSSLATPPSTDDTYTPICGSLLPDPPLSGWLPWSSPATWSDGVVPGVNASANVNVTIPCNVGLLLDLPLVQLLTLEVKGALKFKDDPALPLVNLTASFVKNYGRIIIGSTAQQFQQKAVVYLVPNPNNRAPYTFTAPAPADPQYPRSVGHKAFAVIGGQVDLHGLPGSSATLSWTKLAATAPAGSTTISVRDNVSAWPINAPLVVAPSDYYPDQEDVRVIKSINCTASAGCQIGLDRPLTYNHFAPPLGVPDGFGGYIEEAAEVALLQRNIVVTGADEAAYVFEGGHFIVFMTNTQQLIEGVQFLLMGQQGTLGRYNIHFHVCGDQTNNSVIRKNLIMHSKQRCVVIHATDNALVDSNVAYNTSGHCFMIEEGSEIGNTFKNNLGLRTRAAIKVIPQANSADAETDNTPSTFWITNPNNSYIGNVAAGSEDSGFWLELRSRVRGMSLKWAKRNSSIPIMLPFVGVFVNNTAHSNLFGGFRMYPHGYTPRFNSTVNNINWNMPVWVELGNFNLWKNNQVGAFIHDVDHVVFSNSTLADNTWGIEIEQVQGVNVSNHRIVGLTSNYGNPSNCQYDWGKWNCGPISGCSFPLAPGVAGRSVPWGLANQTTFGVVFDENRELEDGKLANLVSNVKFSAFDATCHAASAVAIVSHRANFWNAGHGFKQLKFSTSTSVNKAFLMPSTFTEGGGFTYYGGEAATFFALRDLDGSIVGAPGGYLVANNSNILPPSSFSPPCSPVPKYNAYACSQACYRTVQIRFEEPGFYPYPAPATWGNTPDSPRLLGDYSYLQVTRLQDGVSMTLAGNLHQYRTGFDNGGGPYSDQTRTFPMSLLAGYTYEVSFFSGRNSASFVPSSLVVEYKDGPGCGKGLVLRFKASAAGQFSWSVQSSDSTTWAPCPGNEAVLTAAVASAPYAFSCSSSSSPPTQALDLNLTAFLKPMDPITLTPVLGTPAPCSSSSRCGLTATRTLWSYNQQNRDLHPVYQGGPAFYNPGYPTPSPAWQTGPGSFGYEGWAQPTINTYLLAPDWALRRTYYFKTSFNVSRSACYSSLVLDVVVLDGVVLYLNNVELMRANMPDGVPDNLTKALSHMTSSEPPAWNLPFVYTTYTLPLTGVNYSLAEGLNHIAAEVHVNVDNGWDVGFALRASVALDTTCTAAAVSPEVCDGVDNNADGKIDVDPATGTLLTRPCWTACGAGIQTCIQGAYQGCTAPLVKQEVCNNVDDNCDGLVDNGPNQLECGTGNVCFRGKCSPLLPLTSTQTVWGTQAPGWTYLDTGVDLTAYPSWVNGTQPAATWKTGTGNFGVFPDNTTWTFGTTLVNNSAGTIGARYFSKSFSLPDATSTFGFQISLQRGDGAVVYLNGVELFRSNMPSGPITYTTYAPRWMACQNPSWDCYALLYTTYGPLRAYGQPVKAGTNWVAVELHPNYQWQKDWVFDLSLTRYAIQKCPTSAACVRNPPLDTTLVSTGDIWTFLDATLPLPPNNWMALTFDDSTWLSGGTPIGKGAYGNINKNMALGTDVGNGRMTYYFRRAVSIVDGGCFYNLTMQVFDNDGAVVYVNGAEAARFNMPSGNVTATTSAITWPTWKWNSVFLSSGWLKSGSNVIAVELHQFSQTTGTVTIATTGNYVFDFKLSGQREGVTCTPMPP